ncbi:MAG: LEA type 2 family protein [Acidobacteriota bacterium]|nr:LEA type 2 family protein [Acidobacteriota bacterium]
MSVQPGFFPARRRLAAGLAAVLLTSSCASLGQFARAIQPLRFSEVPGQQSTIRLAGPSTRQPLGGAALRLWTRISNPNPVGITLSTLRAEVSLDGTRAATGDFPLGLPLAAGADSDVPLDLSIDFADLPGLADVLRRAVANQQVPYEVGGTFSIDAGALGRPSFGPMRLFQGRLGR